MASAHVVALVRAPPKSFGAPRKSTPTPPHSTHTNLILDQTERQTTNQITQRTNQDECARYGTVVALTIPRPGGAGGAGDDPPGVGKVREGASATCGAECDAG